MPDVAPAPKKRRPVLIAALVAVVAGAVAMAIWKPWRTETPTIAVERHTLREVVEVSGSVEAARAVTLKAEATGVVKRLAVPENRRVAEGELLLALDAAQAELARDQAQANASAASAQARTQLANALASQREIARRQQVSLANLANRVSKAQSALAFLEREVRRHEALLAEGAVSVQAAESQRQQLAQARIDLALARDELARVRSGAELVAAANAVAQARTALATAERQGQASVALARKAVADTTLEAPFAGTVTDWLIDPGAWVSPGTPLAQFQDLAELKLVLPVDELDLPKLTRGGPVAITFDAYPDEEMQGTIARISRASVTGTGNVQVFPVEVRFRDPGQRVSPGMSGDARIVVREVKDVLALPLSALKRHLSEFRVTVVKDGERETRTITPGVTTLEYVEVKAGLQEGERVEYAGAASPAPRP